MSVQSVLFVHLAFLYGPSPHAPGSLCGAGSPCTHHAGAPREHGKAMLGTQGDFPVATKVTKGVSGGLPPEPPWGALSSPQRLRRSPQKGVQLRAAPRN